MTYSDELFMLNKTSRTWAAAAPAMVVPFAASLLYFVIVSEDHSARAIYIATKIFTVVWPLVGVYLILHGRLPDIGSIKIGFNKHLQAIPLGTFLGMAIVITLFGLMETPLGQIVADSSENVKGKAQGFGILKHYWSFALFISVIHSLIEEYYWRWFVFGQLKNVVAVPYAHVLAAGSFAGHHIVIATQLFPIAWGLIFGGLAAGGAIIFSIMYDKQKTLLGAWVCHLIVDLGIMAVGHKALFGSYVSCYSN